MDEEMIGDRTEIAPDVNVKTPKSWCRVSIALFEIKRGFFAPKIASCLRRCTIVLASPIFVLASRFFVFASRFHF